MSNYSRTNALIVQINATKEHVSDLMKTYFAALVSVSVVTEHELRVKEIITNYANGISQDFGYYIQNNYERLNGKIQTNHLAGMTKLFGLNYSRKWKEELTQLQADFLREHRYNPVEDYNTLITNRHKFVHAGNYITSLDDTLIQYEHSKIVLDKFETTFAIA